MRIGIKHFKGVDIIVLVFLHEGQYYRLPWRNSKGRVYVSSEWDYEL